MAGCGAVPAAAPEGPRFLWSAVIPVPKQQTNVRQLLQENLKSKPKPRGAGGGEGQDEADPSSGPGIAALGEGSSSEGPGESQMQVLNVTSPREPQTSTWLP